jgi:asparagine N-glycosylation enzyme membrane subunit Stt3
LTLRLNRLQAGQRDNPRAHIQHLGTPASPRELRFNRVAEGWAALSVSLLLILVVALLIFAPTQVLGGVVVLAVVFVLLESIFRGTFTSTVTTIALVLALIASGVLIVTFWWQILVVGFVAAGAFLLWENIRELID